MQVVTKLIILLNKSHFSLLW